MKHVLYILSVALVASSVLGCWQAKGEGGPDKVGKDNNSQTPTERGREAAKASVAAGQLELRQYPPLPSPPGHNEYINILEQRYGIKSTNPKLPKGVKSDEFQKEIQAWNEVMIAEIERKFGKDVLGKAREAGVADWKNSIGGPAAP